MLTQIVNRALSEPRQYGCANRLTEHAASLWI